MPSETVLTVDRDVCQRDVTLDCDRVGECAARCQENVREHFLRTPAVDLAHGQAGRLQVTDRCRHCEDGPDISSGGKPGGTFGIGRSPVTYGLHASED